MTSLCPEKGILAALWLPTDADGQLLFSELRRNLEFLRGSGIDGILALGSTGEFPHFSVENKKRILASVAELAAPLPVIANISDIRPKAVAELGRFARQLGLPAVAIMPPGFFPSSQEDILAHCLNAAEAADLPTFLYNFPELVGTKIELETVRAFAEQAPMAGIKQSGKEFGYHEALIKLGREKNFVVFSGADTRLPEAFSLGVAGCIGGLVNIAPELMVHIYQVCTGVKPGETGTAADQLKWIAGVIDQLTFPLNVAAGMEARGLSTGVAKALVSARSRQLFTKIIGELRPALHAMS